MNTAFNRRHHLNRRCVVLSQDFTYTVECMRYANVTKNGKRVNVRAWFHMRNCVRDFWMGQNGPLRVAIGANANRTVKSIFNCPIRVSRQGFPRKIGQKVRRVSEIRGYHNIAYACCLIWNLSLIRRSQHAQLALHRGF